MTTFLWCAICVLSIFSIWLRHTEEKEKKQFYSVRDRLLKVAEKHMNAGSVVEMPVYGTNEIIDCATGAKEYRFTEITCKGYWRDIYVTIDGKNVTVFKWQEPERRRKSE